MPVFRLDDRLVFPPVHLAEDGLLALGGDLRPERLLLGYTQGIFPWYAENLPILWHSPDPRMVMTTRDLKVQKSLRKQIKRKPYRLAMDTAFEQVLLGCAEVPRPGQTGTWLIPEMVAAYTKLHELGFAHSIEAWQGDELVGGLYGVSLGAAFFGESMFARAPDASKIAFVASVRQLDAWHIGLIDCQVHTEHLARFGAYEITRGKYLELLAIALDEPTRRGKWTFELDLEEFAATGGMLSVAEAEPEAPPVRKKRASGGR
jgi:leucyl/phenylalanyl-tRNA--protein transferase